MSLNPIYADSILPQKVMNILSQNDLKITQYPIDIISIPQYLLDLSNKVHGNLFSWRGQFSPELVEVLLLNYSNSDSIILDPFVGSGTTLFESAYQGLSCYGIDVNPSAFELSKTAHFVNIKISERLKIIKQSEKIFFKYIPTNLLYDENNQQNNDTDLNECFKLLVDESAKYGEYVNNFIINVIMKYYNIKKKSIKNKLLYAFNSHKSIVLRNIPYIDNKIKSIHGDARHIPLDNNSIDLIITSPPYINVFNYHQNYREVMELYRNDILNIAKSEIGSNRKNRGNRFYSVIQYSLDMCDCLKEMKRLLINEGRIIIVVGKESKIINVPFSNYEILTSLATLCSGLTLICRQQRKYTTRFGGKNIEDILHFTINNKIDNEMIAARDVGKYYLYKSLQYANNSAKIKMLDAINHSEEIQPSPLLCKQI